MQLMNPLEAQVRWLLKLGMAVAIITGCTTLIHLTKLYSYYTLYELHKATHSDVADSYVSSGVLVIVFGVLNLVYSGLSIAYLTRTKSRIASHGLEEGLTNTLDQLKKLITFQVVMVSLNLAVTMYQLAASFPTLGR